MRGFYFLMISLGVLYSSYSQGDDSNIIFWSQVDSIQWSDFKGVPDTTFHTFNNRVSKAVSAVGIEFMKREDTTNVYALCYKLYAVFYCNDSWNTGTGISLLNHERGHFSLMELTARKLRRHLLELNEDCNIASLDLELDLAFDDYDSIADQYDQNTVFGTLPSAQIMWSEKIRKELTELEEYSDDTVICLCE